ncbi:MAG: asparaginase [Lachnospiraceae bacterium]|nr:asparaginase [Lachnospiraceae bacterium]
MNAHPEMVAGTHGFCTELMEKTMGSCLESWERKGFTASASGIKTWGSP